MGSILFWQRRHRLLEEMDASVYHPLYSTYIKIKPQISESVKKKVIYE
ncbi:hypothetical protein D3OALGA1CA_3208 [Olavius algarvensis associated proteobacterium Delta 3]|nr:hypothetical protein D3OALGB2SA_2775 [Olavius algarvensis associated proteobacterium Delta 3]CAB5130748.1 hypothetical protein D3OALGA1CA_3208 [Olavius algarvensis associated proteobacterium Delta 3]